MAIEERMRFTLIDAATTVSFVAAPAAAATLVAACAEDPLVIDDLLVSAAHFDRDLPGIVRRGLAIFDEHNVPGDHRAIDAAIQTRRSGDLPLFRVVDETTRRLSRTAVTEGLLIIDLPQRRIMQTTSTADPVRRTGAVPVPNGQGLRQRPLPYALPGNWTIEDHLGG